jgi:uncharacterized membrane protein YczE
MLRRLGILGVGVVLVAVGVALMIRADVGVAPYDVLSTGLADLTGMPIGAAAVVLPLAFTALGVALGGRPGVGTVIAVAAVGPILGGALALLPEVDPMAPRLALFTVGIVLVATGVTAVVVAEVGPGPAELVMLAIHDRGYPLAPVRTGIEVVSVALGWLLGGQVGAGTAVFAVVIGPMLRRMLDAAGYRSAVVVEPAAHT